MQQTKEYRSALILAAAMAGASLMPGGVSGNSETPPPVQDANEDAAYQRYLMDEHRPHREFASLSAQEQQDYWDWRERNRRN
jgi:hypothetical protein